MTDEMELVRDAVTHVSVAIVRVDGAVLLTRRPAGSHLERLWEFPGGKVEAGESPEACAVRETLEETGLEVEAEGLILELRHRYPTKTVHLTFYRCRVLGGKLDAGLQEAGWHPIASLVDLPMPAANAAVIERLLKNVDE